MPFLEWRQQVPSDVGRQLEGLALSEDGIRLLQVSSCLTGNHWDGVLRLCMRTSLEAQWTPACALSTGFSMADVVWMAQTTSLAVAGDDGNCHVFSVDPVSGLDDFCLQMTLSDHEDCLTSVSFEPTKLLLATTSHDGQLKTWDVAKGSAPVNSMQRMKDWNGLFCSPICHNATFIEGTKLLSSYQNGKVMLWDPLVSEGEPVQIFEWVDRSVGAALSLSLSAKSRAEFAIGFENGCIGFVDVRKGFTADCVPRRVHDGCVNRISTCIFDETEMLVSTGDDGMVLANAVSALMSESSKIATCFGQAAHGDYVHGLAIGPSRTGPAVFSAGWDGVVNEFQWEKDFVEDL